MFEDPEKSEKLKPFSLEGLSSQVKEDDLNLREGKKQEPVKNEKRVSDLKATNLLTTRKKCEAKRITIDDIVSTDARILSFGQFISG